MEGGINKTKLDIFLEKIPPLMTYILIFFPIWGGFAIPFVTAYFVIIFNVYFLYKSISFTILFAISLTRIRETENINWLTRLEELDNPEESVAKLKDRLDHIQKLKFTDELDESDKYLNRIIKSRLPRFARKLIFSIEKNKVENFIESEIERIHNDKTLTQGQNWFDLHHVVIIPHWKEPEHVLRATLQRLKDMNYPTKRISVVLGAEARDPEGIEISNQLKAEFEAYFEKIWVNSHELVEGEIVGKSSNMASAGKYAKKQIDKLGWDLKQVTVTSCDADSQLPRNYFANIAYNRVTIKDSEYKFFNGAMTLYANIWRLPFYARVKNSMSTIYNVGRLVRTDKLVPFSTYTTSYWLIDQVGYWTAHITPEDFHIFFKSLFKFPDKVSTIPIYQRILSDAAEGEGHMETIKNNYFQERRWSWGISDDGWLIKNTVINILNGKATISMLYRTIHVVIDHILGPVSAIIILFGGNIPLLVNPAFANTVTGINLPRISSFMIQLTVYFLIASIILDLYLKPKQPGKRSFIKWFFNILEWVIQPFVGFLLVAIPGIEAHTRLLFGKYLEYYLTKKK